MRLQNKKDIILGVHKPIKFKGVMLYSPDEVCFENFDYEIYYGDRIAIIGENKDYKSMLLLIIDSICKEKVNSFYLEKVITEENDSEIINNNLMKAIELLPDMLLLNEPDMFFQGQSIQDLISALKNFPGTLIFVSSNKDILVNCANIYWHINNGKIDVLRSSEVC